MKEPQYRGVDELRRMFLEFFESKDHLAMKSFSLVSHNGNSLLLVNSGVAPLEPYFTGQEIPPRKRAITCQKCIRTGGIGNIGKTARHGTFFEMLGSFSFGDYSRTEAIRWAWEFLTDVVGLDPGGLYPSVYLDDGEAFGIQDREIGIPAEHIFKFDKEDNFWEYGSGPCGPYSEIYYDRGGAFGCGKPGCTIGCNCGRYIEIWNNVFTQFDNDGHGHYTELKHKNINTGTGLERLTVVVQGVDSLFATDTNKALLDRVCEFAHTEYQRDHGTDVSLHIVADYVKSCTFVISDGIIPSNEGRGYMPRHLLRRAAHHGRKLGIEGRFLAGLSETVIELPKDGCPKLEEKQAMIFKVLSEEEEKFNKTIDQGLSILGEMEDEMQKNGNKCLSGTNALKLYDTYGFPLDLTKEISEERGCTVDEGDFAAAMKGQKERAREVRRTTNYIGADMTVCQSIDPSVTTEFIGYGRLTADSRMTALTTEDELIRALASRQKGTIIVERTPFYGTMGGQQGDTGVVSDEDGSFKVEDIIYLQGGKVDHVGVMTRGIFQVGETVTLSVYAHNRALTRKNHSATRLLQKALREVLGDHVEQAGSYMDTGRPRFNFTHFSAMTPDEIKRVEEPVNQEIRASLPVITQVMTLGGAKKTGAMALFGEKYGDRVRVVRMGDFSTELCGGTHVSSIGTIAYFKIISKAGIAAGVRRVEALTSEGLMKHYQEVKEELQEAARTTKTASYALTSKIQSLLEEIKTLRSGNGKLKSKLANNSLRDVMGQVEEVNGLKVLTVKVTGVNIGGIGNLDDQLKNKLGEGVAVLACEQDGKISLVATATDSAQKKGARARNLIKATAGLMGGGGGDRPNMAQTGGENLAGIDDALKKAVEIVEEQTKWCMCR